MQKSRTDYRLLSFWSWNGEMESEEVRNQIRQFAERGYGGFFIHARAGLQIEYMQEEWFDACRAAIEEAEVLGLSVWLYDENGWPSGFASGEVNGQGEAYQAKRLFFTDQYFEDTEGSRFLAAYRRQEGSFVRCEAEDPKAVLFCGYELVEHYADVLCREVVGRFIRVTHQAYYDRFREYFGTVIRGIFTDEPQAMFPAWSPALAEGYRENWGGDILDGLWMLQEQQGDYWNFRYRYFDTLSKVFRDSYTKQIHEWCEGHGIHLTGHFPNEDGAYMQVKLIGGVMPNYPYMGVPGIDFLGKRYPSPVLMKQVSSVAHQTGKKQVLSESYGCAGWDISFRELMSLASYQAVMGVNTLCTHLSAYTIFGRRKRDYPAFYSYQEPWWEQFSFVSGYIRTVNEILSELQRFTHVAVLHPLRSIWCEVQMMAEAQGLVNAGAGAAESTEFRMLVELLNDLQIDFDLIDDEMLTGMECRNGVIQNKHVSYDILILPHMISICDETRRYISEFGNQGGRILAVNGTPELIEGRKAENIFDCPVTEVYNSHNLLMKHFLTMQYPRECVLLDAESHNPVRGLIVSYGEDESGDRVCFAFNQSDGFVETTARQEGAWYPYLYDCAEDRLTELPFTQDGTYTYAPIGLTAKDSRMIKFLRQPVKAHGYPKVKRTWQAANVEVELKEKNAFNIDYASYRIDEGEWSEPLPVVWLADRIHQQRNGQEKRLQIRYRFLAEYLSSSLTLAVENVNRVQVTVNQAIADPEEDWWLDKKISCYDISGIAKKGENEVILTYSLEKQEQYIDLSERFESERNRFSYKIEPESIYIIGEFDVNTDTVPEETPGCLLLEKETKFCLSAPAPKTTGDLTAQGLWFYRGAADYTFGLSYDGENRIFVKPQDMHGTAVRIMVNGKNGGVHTGADPVDITELLDAGENTVILAILGHNRNLLGPHHHRKHNPVFVGPSTFAGKRGFEDFVNPELVSEDTWTGDYSFVHFGCSGAEVIECAKKGEVQKL